MTTNIDSIGVTKTGYLVPAKTTTSQSKISDIFKDFQNKQTTPPIMFQYVKGLDGMSGNPLITVAQDRGERGYQSSGTPVQLEVLENKLKEKNLDKDTRLTIELEIKRQKQGGFLTAEQNNQWVELRDRKIEEGREKFAKNINLKM